MRVLIDLQACQGHGRCAAVAPSLFQLSSEGYVVTPVIDVPEGLEDDARHAVANCPEMAISIEGE